MSSSSRSRNVAQQSTGDTQHNVRDAALIGAASAFAKPPPKPQHLANTYTGGSNGALLAATKVGTGRPTSSAGAPVQRDYTGGSSRSVSRPHPSPKHVSSSSSLSVPDTYSDRAPSPSASASYTAAKLAAARMSPLRPAAPPRTPVMMASEREADERDVLPPSGSVGSVLARLEQQNPGPGPQHKSPRPTQGSAASQPAARAAVAEPRGKPTDDTPIPPTNSLVNMFEQRRPATPTQRPTAPAVGVKSPPPPIKSPKPRRTFTLPPEPEDDAPPLARTRTKTPPPLPKSKPSVEAPRPQLVDGAHESSLARVQTLPLKSPPIKQKPIQLAALNTKALARPTSPSQTGPKSQESRRSATSHRRLSTSLESKTPSSPAVSFKSAKEEQDEDERARLAVASPVEEDPKAKPTLPPPRRSNTRKTESAPPDNKLLKPALPPPRKQAQSASPLPPSDRLHPPERLSPARRPSSAAGGSVYHNPYQRESVKAITKHMTGESLSSAIMGAALASSRTSSPAPPPQPPTLDPLFPARKHHHHHHMPFHRSPSPPKNSPPKATGKLRTTMRKDPSPASSSEDEFEFKGKGNRIMGLKVRKHPNKHHEGQRKRWRDALTERERKRYEGVWAANRGIFLPSAREPQQHTAEEDPSLDVLNLVVKEIWTRSRLPEHVLEEVWALVDGREIGRLSRVEFVVGLWLVDQRLKGRKLPTRVSESVWSSARGLGIKVKVRG
ncbi:hypothetical protein B5807_03231 [Epicoccum nigrum]|uniref:EH domain-containing protein n=1 Tax=Epicoccum nigrum TaxID=105696 RepID=A0A1Y2M6A5_EPING|nr:hypothetical protein B5807_03231 [Epicoccum nigrum]